MVEGSDVRPEGDEIGRGELGTFEVTNVEHRLYAQSSLKECDRGNQREEEQDPRFSRRP
jgi:hypothetical protein